MTLRSTLFRRTGRARAMTLVELLVALSITAIVSAAIAMMLRAGAMVSASIQNSSTSEWEVESAICRMVEQTRVCTSFNVPTTTSGGTSFSVVTQPDTNNGNLTYAITYSQITAADGTLQLQENDTRYGNSILIHNIQSFDVRYKSAGTPYVLVITITAGKVPTSVTRIVKIMPRNQ